MTAPVREDVAVAPAPTVRAPGYRAARWLAFAALDTIVAGVCGGYLLWMTRRHALAVEVAILCGVAAVGLLAIAGVVAVRARRINLNPAAAIPLIAVAAAAAWLSLPLFGLAPYRWVALAAAAWAAERAARLGIRHHRRRAVEDRISQALAPELAQSIHQAEQVYAGLTRTTDRLRATAPHYGTAPHAAWNLRGTRWNGSRILAAYLRLPSHGDITNPDFLARIRRALKTRCGLEVRLSPDPLRDGIMMNFDVSEEQEDSQPDRKEAAKTRAGTALAQALHQKEAEVEVIILEWDEQDSPPLAPPAWPLRKFQIRYGQTPKVTAEASREMLRMHMSLQLFGDESVLRHDWDLGTDTVTFTRRAEFPARIPHLPVDVAALFGDLLVIVHATDDDGNLVGWQLTETDAPHELMSGPTGTGKSVDLRTVMIEAARLGCEVRGIDPKRIEMRGLRGWPNITVIATRVPDMVRVVDKTFDDMMRRYEDIEASRARAEDFQMIVLTIDEYIMFTMLVNDYWMGGAKQAAGADSKEHPVFRKLTALLVLARGANIRVRIASQRVDATLFSDRTLGGVRDNLAARVALGRQTKEAAGMMFGDSNAGRDIPLGSIAVGTILGPFGRVRAKMHWLPDPAYWNDEKKPLTAEERRLLLDMLPPGSHWDGPLPYQPPVGGGGGDDRPAKPNPANQLLIFARTALRTRDAYLTDAATGGPPASGPQASFYGWSLTAAGKLEHSGTWIGCVASTPEGRRVYLYPDRVLEVVERLAVPLEVPFPYTRQDLDTALHATGMLKTETTGGGKTRWTVRRQLRGHDLPGDDRQRVWDLPADEVLGDLAEDDDVPAPAGSVFPGDAPEALPAAAGGIPVREARFLDTDTRIVIVGDDGEAVEASVLGKAEDGADLLIDYLPDGGVPDTIRVQPDQHIRLADPDGEA